MNKVILLSLFVFSVSAHAGLSNPNGATCTKNADGSGVCSGTIKGFRNTANSTDYVEFAYNSDPSFVTRAFYASFNGQFMGCSPTATSVVSSVWPMAMDNTDSFQITWDASGTCTNIFLAHSSWAIP
jgi:hypothetical protein